MSLFLALIFSSLAFAQEDLQLPEDLDAEIFQFNEDPFQEPELGTIETDEESTDSADTLDFEFENTSSDLFLEDNSISNEKIEEDLEFLPSQPSPKLNPETKVVTTKRGRYIYHPNQEKGLYKINRSNEYLYKYKKSPFSGTYTFKLGSYNFENFPTDKTKFSSIYGSERLTSFFLDYEWRVFKDIKSFAVILGGGLAYARGNARFNNQQLNDLYGSSRDGINLLMFSASAGATYKLLLSPDVLFVPYVSGALNYNLLTESRNGVNFDGFERVGIWGAHFGGGLGLNLGWLERSAALNLDRDFGVNNTYLTFEARQIISFDKDWNLNGLMFLGGLSFEY